MLGLCPFHNEKTPSFTVSPAKGIYKCFGCGEAGNSVNFVMKHESMTYPEALRYLAAKYGIEIQEKERTDEDKRKEVERESLMGVTAFAQSHFSDILKTNKEGKAIGLQYFNERGFNDYIIEKFQLGYAVEEWDNLRNAAIEKGYSEEVLIKTGLVVKTDEGKVYDRFRGRVIFPIHNISGRPIGFGGRILDSSKSKAKYVNSPESEIYHKSDVLYGLHLARTAMIKADNCYLVEGYTDVISMHKAGVENVVASSGTSLTTGQIKLIKRYTNQITILYDGDAAGIKASFRGIDMIIAEGLTVRIVLFPEGEDPDSFARSRSADEITDFITKQSKDFIIFKSDMLKGEAGNDPAKKAKMIKDIVESISLVPENIDRLLYTKEASSIVDIDEQILIDEVNKYRRKKLFQGKKYDTPPPPDPLSQKAPTQLLLEDNTLRFENEIIRVLLNYGAFEFTPSLSGLSFLSSQMGDESYNVAQFIVGSLNADDIQIKEKEALSKIYQEFMEAIAQETLPSEKLFINHGDEEVRIQAINLLTQPYQLGKWDKVGIEVAMEDEDKVLARTVMEAIFTYKLKITDKTILSLTEKLKDPDICVEMITKIQEDIKSLTSTRNKMGKDMSRVVLK